MSLVACKRLVYILIQFRSSAPNCSIQICSDVIQVIFFFHKLFIDILVCFFDLVIYSRISTFSINGVYYE